MRQFINIISEAIGIRDIASRVHHQAVGIYHELEDRDWEQRGEVSDEILDGVSDRLEKLFARGPVKVWRYLILERPYRENVLERQHEVGIYWTFRPTHLNLDALNIWEDDGDLLLMEATITKEMVDWDQTVIANIQLPWESEITLKKGAHFKVERVYLLDDHDVDANRRNLLISFDAIA